MPEHVPLWLYFLSIVIAAFPGMYATWRQRRKTDAEAGKANAETAQVLTDIAREMVTQLEKRIESQERKLEHQEQELARQADVIEELKCRVRTLERENADLWRGNSALVNQVMELGEDPAWMPGDTRLPR